MQNAPSPFAPPKLTTLGEKRSHEIVEAFHGLQDKLQEICPDGREYSIVKTKLEEAAHFAIKSLVNVPENWEGAGVGGAGRRVA
jgi:hypothetical protein